MEISLQMVSVREELPVLNVSHDAADRMSKLVKKSKLLILMP